MSKMLKMKHFLGQRPLLAMSLAASLAAFGCTTDRNLGNGRPDGWSGVRTAPTSGVTSGSETAPTPPPMTSSYSRPEPLPRVSRTIHRLTPDEAAAIMADNRPKVRILGPANPGLRGNVYYSARQVTGQWQNPAMITNPQQTINSSLTSGPTGGAITPGFDDADVGAFPVAEGTSGNVIAGTDGTVANATVNATSVATAAPVFTTGATVAAPASTVTATTIAPTFATPTNTTTTTPTTIAGTAAPASTVTAAGAIARMNSTMGVRPNATTSSARTNTAATRAARSATTRANATVGTRGAAATATVATPVRVVSSTSGLTITNQQ